MYLLLFSVFSEYFSYILLSEELKILFEGKWKFKWEVLVIDMLNCRWKGIRLNFFDVCVFRNIWL